MAKAEIHFGLKPILHFSYLSVLKDGAIQNAKIVITKSVQRTATFVYSFIIIKKIFRCAAPTCMRMYECYKYDGALHQYVRLCAIEMTSFEKMSSLTVN